MSVQHTPAPARSDVRRPATVGANTPARPFFKRGMLLTVGAVAWGLDSLILGTDPSGAMEEAFSSITSGTFQLGIMGLLTVLFATQALGEGRLARFFLRGPYAIDLVLIAVVYVALTSGPVTGMLSGTVAGLMQDALSSGVIGIGGLAKTIVGFLAGSLSVVFDLSWNTVFVSVTKRERYVEAMSLLNGSRSLAYVAGPTIGGLLVQVLGAPLAMLTDALSFLGSVVFLRRIRSPEPPIEPNGKEP